LTATCVEKCLQNFAFCTSLKKISELPYAAGHYVPQLAELVYERNNKKGKSYINLKGFIVRISISFSDERIFLLTKLFHDQNDTEVE